MREGMSVRAESRGRGRLATDLRVVDGAAGPPSTPSDARGPISPWGVLLGAGYGLSALAQGYYAGRVWELIGLGTIVVLTLLLVRVLPDIGRAGTVALVAIAGLAVWSALSMLWADSVDAAWTETNRIGLYLVTFGLGTVAMSRPRARVAAIATMMGAAAAVALVVVVRLLLHGGPALFLEHRLNWPLGYINGEAGFLLMGFWLLLAGAEAAPRRALSAACAGLATVCADLLVLTQSRAIVPALLLSSVVVLAMVPGRARRAWLLLVVIGAMASALPALLDVYAEHGAVAGSVPRAGTTRWAGVAVLLSAAGAVLAISVLEPFLRRRVASRRGRRLVAGAAGAAAVGVVALAAALLPNPV
ncbi:MAG: O-antigen polymerase, partial [Solirubrobacterales bacterium]|nr:O-antigen polymerase [Solirubrobacterales bacterium]